MPPQSWFNQLDEETRIRVRMTTNRRGEVTVFTLQLELLVDGKWMPVVRYDTAHGQAHIDFLNPQGDTYDKVWLAQRAPYNTAFTLAESELEQFAEFHRQRFLGQMRGEGG